MARRATTSNTTKPRVFGYARVSTDGQAEDGQSLDVQQRQIEGWAMQRGVKLDAMHVEAGISGGVPFDERPEGGRLSAALQRGDTLVASKLDRMFRSAADCLKVVEAFKAHGVSLYLLDLNGGADDVSGNGIARLFLTIVSAFAEFERDRIGERIRAAKRQQRANSEFLGGSVAFGYRRRGDHLVPDPVQQRVIKRARGLHARGLSLRAIKADLAKRGHVLSHVLIGRLVKES